MSDVVPVAAAEMAAAGFSRIALGLEYKGARYRGFQRQAGNVSSIQGCLESALSKVAGGEPINIMCAGRTDASVRPAHMMFTGAPPATFDRASSRQP